MTFAAMGHCTRRAPPSPFPMVAVAFILPDIIEVTA